MKWACREQSAKGGLTVSGMMCRTNTLAAKTASMAGPQTMFEMCSETRRRLRRVNGYDRFIGELFSP